MRAARPFVGPRVSSRESAAWRPRVSPSILTPPMLLAININNTETKVGLFRGDSLEAHWRLTTTPSRTPDEWAQALTSYLTQAGRSTQEVRAAILASVVRSEEHTSELQSRSDLVCRLLLEKKK